MFIIDKNMIGSATSTLMTHKKVRMVPGNTGMASSKPNTTIAMVRGAAMRGRLVCRRTKGPLRSRLSRGVS